MVPIHNLKFKMRIITIKHNNLPFESNEWALLLATGVIHHIILLL